MAILDFLISLISFDNILALDWMVKGPGILIIGWFVVRALDSLFKFRFIRAANGLLNAFVLTLILSRAGFAIQTFLLGPPPAS